MLGRNVCGLQNEHNEHLFHEVYVCGPNVLLLVQVIQPFLLLYHMDEQGEVKHENPNAYGRYGQPETQCDV